MASVSVRSASKTIVILSEAKGLLLVSLRMTILFLDCYCVTAFGALCSAITCFA
jgi:hypothetical protein